MICTFWLAFFSSSLLRTLYQVQKFDTMCRIPLGNDMLLIYIYIFYTQYVSMQVLLRTWCISLDTVSKRANIVENMVCFFHSLRGGMVDQAV